jgi:asparagine synthase (glutamine-hydrolysing)
METLDDVRAAQVASACGLKHQLLRLGPDFFAGFAAHADRTVFLTDGCFGITGAHEIYFSRLARQLAPVRLTGVFGGEILRGVSTFKLARLAPGLLTPEMTPLLDAASNRFGQLNRHPVGFAAFQEVPLNIFGSLSATQSQVHFRTPYLDNELVALACQTPRAFQHSGAPVFAFVRNHHPRLGAIPTDMGYVGDLAGWRARAAGISARITFKLDYLSNDGLPHWLSPLDPVLDGLHTRGGLLGRHKFLRYRRWFRRELAPWVQEAMAGTVAAPSPFWNLAFLRQLAARHVSGRNNFQRELNAVLTLQAVERLLFHPPPATG